MAREMTHLGTPSEYSNLKNIHIWLTKRYNFGHITFLNSLDNLAKYNF